MLLLPLRGGTVLRQYHSTHHKRGLHTLTFEAFDAIDLCSLGLVLSFGCRALGKDGTIMMCRDVIEETLNKRASVTTRYAAIKDSVSGSECSG